MSLPHVWTGTGKGGHTGMVPPDQVKSTLCPVWSLVWVDNSVSMSIQRWFLYQGSKFCTIYWEINHYFSFSLKLPVCFVMKCIKGKLYTVVPADSRSGCSVKERISVPGCVMLPWSWLWHMWGSLLSPFNLLTNRKLTQKKEQVAEIFLLHPLGLDHPFSPTRGILILF